jgi:REP element-mobilizing transposase RayT
MSHTHASVLVHCVFSTKQRANIIPDPEAIWRYLAVVARDHKITLLAAGGTANHTHLLMAIPPVLPLAKAVQELKASSSRWLHEHGYRFAWQEGYGAFSVSQSQRQTVIDYIAKQAEHHKQWSFEQEFMTLLRRSRVEYDPRFVFGEEVPSLPGLEFPRTVHPGLRPGLN